SQSPAPRAGADGTGREPLNLWLASGLAVVAAAALLLVRRPERSALRLTRHSFLDTLHADHLHLFNGSLEIVLTCDPRAREAEFGRLAQPLLAALHRTYLASQADLAEHYQAGRQRPIAQRGYDRQQDGEIRGRLVDLDPAYGVHEHVLIECRHPGVTMQHG